MECEMCGRWFSSSNTNERRCAACDRKRKNAKTNADRIRAMSDEELAKIIAADCLDERLHFCQNKPECVDILERGECVPEELCVKCVLDWLSRSAEED